jgi:hypothetical protein
MKSSGHELARGPVGLAELVLVILEVARERQAEGAGRAEAIAESTNDALDLIRKARAGRFSSDDRDLN